MNDTYPDDTPASQTNSVHVYSAHYLYDMPDGNRVKAWSAFGHPGGLLADERSMFEAAERALSATTWNLDILWVRYQGVYEGGIR